MVACYSGQRKLIHNCNGKIHIFPSWVGKNPVLSYHVVLSCEFPWLLTHLFIFDTSGHQICEEFPHTNNYFQGKVSKNWILNVLILTLSTHRGLSPTGLLPNATSGASWNTGFSDQPAIDLRFQKLFFAFHQSTSSGKHSLLKTMIKSTDEHPAGGEAKGKVRSKGLGALMLSPDVPLSLQPMCSPIQKFFALLQFHRGLLT